MSRQRAPQMRSAAPGIAQDGAKPASRVVDAAGGLSRLCVAPGPPAFPAAPARHHPQRGAEVERLRAVAAGQPGDQCADTDGLAAARDPMWAGGEVGL